MQQVLVVFTIYICVNFTVMFNVRLMPTLHIIIVFIEEFDGYLGIVSS